MLTFKKNKILKLPTKNHCMKTKILFLFFSCLFFSCSNDDIINNEPMSLSTTRGAINQSYGSIGVSYDITSEYLSIDATKYPVIDVNSFLKQNPNSYVVNSTTQANSDPLYSGTNAFDYLEDIKSKSGMKMDATIPILGASLAANLSRDKELNNIKQYSSKSSYARHERIKRLNRTYLNATPSMLQNYLHPEFTRDLNQMDPLKFVEKYGTHILLDVTNGGKIKTVFKSVVNSISSTTNKKTTVEAGIKLTVLDAGTGRSFTETREQLKKLSENNSHVSISITYEGGSNSGTSYTYTPEGGITSVNINITQWEEGITTSNSTIVDINWNNTYPIYDFIADPSKKAAIKAATLKYIDNKKVELIKVKPLYRLWKNSTKNSFPSSSEQEVQYYLAKEGYELDYGNNYNPLQGFIFETQISGTIPLYRLWKAGSVKNNFLSTSINEVNNYTTKEGYGYDYGYNTHYILGYIYKDGSNINSLPLFRLWKGGSVKNSFWTSSETEAYYYLGKEGYGWDYGYNSHYILGYLIDPAS